MLTTGIELQDNFSSVLYGIMDSVSLAIGTMYDMQQAMSADVDMSSLDAARDSISQTTAALAEMNNAMDWTSTAPPPVVTPEPVEVPLTWQTDGLEVFTGTGIDRFRQEVQRTDAVMEQLCSTQDSIASQALYMNILPPGAFQDLNSLAVRMDNVRERIGQIENNPMNLGTDIANAELEQMYAQLNLATQQQEELNRALQDMDVSAANRAYLNLSQTIGSTEQYIRDNVDEQGRFNQMIRDGTTQADNLMNSIMGIAAAYLSIQGVKNVLDTSDELTQTTARLNLMNDGVQTTQELVDMVYMSAQDARGSFDGMADVVARFGNNAKDAFGSSAEVVDFANLIQKQMTIAGASTQESTNAMLQLSQALGSGVLRGDELNSIFEQAPNLIQNIADYMGEPIGAIREMASEGQLTADIVKASIFAASDDINAKFNEMPMTWGQAMQSFQNTALIAFQPVLQEINQLANSEGFQNFANGAIETMGIVAVAVLNIFELMGAAGSFIADNWSWISPVIYGVAGALAVYYGAKLAANAVDAIGYGIHLVMAAAQMAHAAATGMLTTATAAEIAAQNGLNGAMYACPLVWIVMLVIALVAAFYGAVAAVNHFAGTSVSATGIICGVLAVAAAFIWNQIAMVINYIIDCFVVLWNFIAAFANFFANVFNDPVGAIARLFFDLADCVLSILESLASAIDTVFGSNLASAVSGWRGSLGGWVDDTFGKGDEVMEKLNSSDYHVKSFNYGDAWNFGYNMGQGIEGKITDFFNGGNTPGAETYTPQNYGGGGGIAEGIDGSGAAGNISDIKDSVSVTQEELKYLRDLAEQETVNRYTVAQIHIDQTNNNTVSTGTDLDGIVTGLTDAVKEATEIITEGVHD